MFGDLSPQPGRGVAAVIWKSLDDMGTFSTSPRLRGEVGRRPGEGFWLLSTNYKSHDPLDGACMGIFRAEVKDLGKVGIWRTQENSKENAASRRNEFGRDVQITMP